MKEQLFALGVCVLLLVTTACRVKTVTYAEVGAPSHPDAPLSHAYASQGPQKIYTCPEMRMHFKAFHGPKFMKIDGLQWIGNWGLTQTSVDTKNDPYYRVLEPYKFINHSQRIECYGGTAQVIRVDANLKSNGTQAETARAYNVALDVQLPASGELCKKTGRFTVSCPAAAKPIVIK